MIVLRVTDKKLIDQKTPCYVFLIEQDTLPKDVLTFSDKWCPDVPDLLEQSEFTGKYLQSKVFPAMVHGKLAHLIFVGLGKKEDREPIDFERYRRVLGKVVRIAQQHKCESCAIAIPSPKLFGVDSHYLGQQTATILNMANYHFNEFISEKERKGTEVFEVTLCPRLDAKSVSSSEKKEFTAGVKEGEIIGQAVNKARHWVDLPPSALTPPSLAAKAKQIAKEYGLKCTVFNEKQITEMGMGGLAGVSAGSELDCRLVILEYKAKKKNAPTLCFVGKGITFDSGGLSLKPAQFMETMKEDMSGAAAVIATMEALAQLKPDVNVIGITPLSENLPSGKATKPGDILRFYNGKTAEVKNTDAEGRLVLADALSYAEKHYKPDMIIDLATLTGACAYALGPFYTGLMSQDDDLVDIVLDSGYHSGDALWRLPLSDDYKVAIKSEVADIANTGNKRYMAGAITAGHFLKNFVSETPWVHCDIAGTAFNVPDIPYYRAGATGVGVRLLVDLAMNWE